jgi:SARP family transcriptional regulator, regulator of embCAB operon
LARIKVQLCGRLAVVVDGERVEERLPGRQGRLLFAYLALNRRRTLARDELVEAVWPEGRDGGLAPLLSKLRKVVPVSGTALELPQEAWVDVEAAADAVHRAESSVAQRDFRRAWGPSQVALFVAARPLLPDDSTPWIEDERRRLGDLHLRALEAYGAAALGIGGTERAAAVRAGRELTRLEPYRESGWRLLMEGLAAEGNVAEALAVYERLRGLLREELGIAPSASTQELHRELLA